MLKPHLACDADLGKLAYPCILMPKIDGVRSVNFDGHLTGRTLKRHGNYLVNNRFDGDEFKFLDGEMAFGGLTDSDLCRKTSSKLSRIDDPDISKLTWNIFDYLRSPNSHYIARLQQLEEYLYKLNDPKIKIVHYKQCKNLDELLEYETECLNLGFEGLIIRDPYARHKNGRCTVREGAYLRLKRFIESEAIVSEIIEGESNNNDAVINKLGQTERSSKKEGMVKNGMVGSMLCLDCVTGQLITVAPGKMTHNERIRYFKNPKSLIGKVIKYKYFPVGIKDLPRFPTFQCIRSQADF